MSSIIVATSLALVCLAACADDAPAGTDAAACACPAAEPPLAGRIVLLSGEGDIPAHQTGVAGRVCPAGATVLGGGCRLQLDSWPGISLRESGVLDGGPSWYCVWESTAPVATVGIAQVICLVPAP